MLQGQAEENSGCCLLKDSLLINVYQAVCVFHPPEPLCINSTARCIRAGTHIRRWAFRSSSILQTRVFSFLFKVFTTKLQGDVCLTGSFFFSNHLKALFFFFFIRSCVSLVFFASLFQEKEAEGITRFFCIGSLDKNRPFKYGLHLCWATMPSKGSF